MGVSVPTATASCERTPDTSPLPNRTLAVSGSRRYVLDALPLKRRCSRHGVEPQFADGSHRLLEPVSTATAKRWGGVPAETSAYSWPAPKQCKGSESGGGAA